MPYTPGGIWIPDSFSPIAPIENLFIAQATSIDNVLNSFAKTKRVANLTNLAAITDAQIGDIRMVIGAGTGINAINFQAYSGSGSGIKWRTIETVYATTLANLNSFIAAVAATPDVEFRPNSLAMVTDQAMLYRFSSVGDGTIVPLVPFIGATISQDSIPNPTMVEAPHDSIITTQNFPERPYPTTAYLECDAAMGFMPTDVTVAVAISSSGGTLTQRVNRQVRALAGQWATVSQSAKLLLPANTEVNVIYRIASSGNVYCDFSHSFRRVTR